MNTVSFLNHFAQSCESRLLEFEYKLQKVEASLLILESQLSSISDLNELNQEKQVVQSVQTPEHSNESSPTISTSLPSANETVSNVEIPDDAKSDIPAECKEEESHEGVKATEDPRFMKFFKMVQFGVPPAAVKLKMQSEGVDPNILE